MGTERLYHMTLKIKYVGDVGSLPGTEGFVCAVFKAEDVPNKTPLYVVRSENSTDLAECCKEILMWNSCGVLPGTNLRARAEALKNRGVYDEAQALRRAEDLVAREAMRFVIEVFEREQRRNAMAKLLREVRDCCLVDDDDGIVVTTDPHISEDLFTRINDFCRTGALPLDSTDTPVEVDPPSQEDTFAAGYYAAMKALDHMPGHHGSAYREWKDAQP